MSDHRSDAGRDGPTVAGTFTWEDFSPATPSLIEDIESGTFFPANDLPEWVETTFLHPSSPIHNEEDAHLAHAEIGFLWTVENSRKGRRIIGQCEEGKPQGAMGKWARARAEMQVKQWFGFVPEFIITLDAEYYRQCGDAEFMALVEHELDHAAKETDAFGAPKFSTSTVRPVLTAKSSSSSFVPMGRRRWCPCDRRCCQPPPEIARGQIAHACGTCQLRAALGQR
ncbi:putative metallopeptidase (plasmid) [Sinorhizobium kummerowiae]|uniref:putative metallopeptidase n=1 Tax=Sinorhizobium kummerowiae TaxID=158892 RepID=UPI002B4C22A8|nr:putative metallopeptidase [Sinorhizobium kummerowiae]WRW48852.1 putative metallopeptidase [Sinorhizobium kummerowiae]